MNEEELFCKLFPEYVVNGKPLSPYFDLFESGYEQAEKRIEELEMTVGTLRTFSNEQATCIERLEAQIEKMKRCEICKHYPEGSCDYQYYSQQVCKENGMKLFELKEIKEK